MLSECEAREKLCPQTMCGAIDVGKCRASDCMAWRWGLVSSTEMTQTKSEMVVQEAGYTYWKPIPPPGDGWVQVHDWQVDANGKRSLKESRHVGVADWHRRNYGDRRVNGVPARGYCGLAGKGDNE